jgi:hypothetical protein
MGLFEKTRLGQSLKAAKRLDSGKLFIEFMNDDAVEKFTVDLNTEQMKSGFMDSNGVQLSDIGGAYSPMTVATGRKKNAESVDLYDTGAFHKSFRIEKITADGFEIVSDPVKGDGTNLLDEWGEAVEGLTFESKDQLAKFLLNLYQIKTLNILRVENID